MPGLCNSYSLLHHPHGSFVGNRYAGVFFFRLDQELPYLNGLTNTGAALKIITEQVINSAYDRCVDFSRFFTIFHVVILIKTS